MSKESDASSKADATSGLARRAYPRSPLGIIALFVFLIEAIATVSLKFLLSVASPYTVEIVRFIWAFPILILFLFFGTLWFRRESLYSPSDFSDPAHFMQLIARVDARFEKVEIRQKAAQLDPRGDPADVFALIPDLLAKDDIETVISLGRAFLKVKRYANSLDVFMLLSRLPLSGNSQLQVIALKAYSLNGLGRHEDALAALSELRRLSPQESEKFWPSLAAAYAYFKLGDKTEFIAWIEKATRRSNAYEYLDLAFQIYPDPRQDLTERIIPRPGVTK